MDFRRQLGLVLSLKPLIAIVSPGGRLRLAFPLVGPRLQPLLKSSSLKRQFSPPQP